MLGSSSCVWVLLINVCGIAGWWFMVMFVYLDCYLLNSIDLVCSCCYDWFY